MHRLVHLPVAVASGVAGPSAYFEADASPILVNSEIRRTGNLFEVSRLP